MLITLSRLESNDPVHICTRVLQVYEQTVFLDLNYVFIVQKNTFCLFKTEFKAKNCFLEI